MLGFEAGAAAGASLEEIFGRSIGPTMSYLRLANLILDIVTS